MLFRSVQQFNRNFIGIPLNIQSLVLEASGLSQTRLALVRPAVWCSPAGGLPSFAGQCQKYIYPWYILACCTYFPAKTDVCEDNHPYEEEEQEAADVLGDLLLESRGKVAK